MIETADDNRRKIESAFLVGVRDEHTSEAVLAEQLDELAELVRNLEIDVVGRSVAHLSDPRSTYYLGSGKAGEIVREAQMCEADILVFDIELTPSQQRNWERLFHGTVIDRAEVILDIFAARASTREAVLQVELARLNYYLPRLSKAWSHLSRQRGGVTGARGQGETQIETDRRIVRRRIAQLDGELAEVRRQRDTGRKSRGRKELLQGAIVGYTNVGKSSLLKRLSGADVLVEDKLFATLDPTTRRVRLADAPDILLTDTVGFVRKLPHDLVEAFKSTLEEALISDFLIIVMDLSSPQLEEQWETTAAVLNELGGADKETIVIFNKLDKIRAGELLMAKVRTRTLYPDGLFVSTHTNEGMDELVRRIGAIASADTRVMKILLPASRHDLAALAHRSCEILDKHYDDAGNLAMTLRARNNLLEKFEAYKEQTLQ